MGSLQGKSIEEKVGCHKCSVWGLRGKKRVKTISAETKVREERAEVVWALEQDSPAALGGDHDGADIHCGGPFGGARYFLKQTAASEGEPMQEQVLLTRTVVHGGLTLEQVYPAGLQPMEWAHTGALCEGLQPTVRTHTGSGAQCEVGGVAGRKHYRLTAASHFPPLVLLGRVEEVEELGM